MTEKKVILNEEQLKKTINRMVDEILERNENLDNLFIVGLQTRGVFLAERIIAKIKELEGIEIPLGVLDTSLYRDDFSENFKMSLKETDFPFSPDDKDIILVDDVLYTGRSVRAAMECIMDFGRPRFIRLAVLIDRGHRELPIQPDIVGKKFITIPDKESIEVNLKEIDDIDAVFLGE
jgi:pyrimidine operon attenuation protein/uracil phosphoribosyltransferase